MITTAMTNKTGRKARDFMERIEGLIAKETSESWTLERVADKEVDDFLQYKELARAWQEFSDLTIGICEELDEQSRALVSLQINMKTLLEEKGK